MEYREKKFKSGGEKGKKNWKKETSPRYPAVSFRGLVYAGHL